MKLNVTKVSQKGHFVSKITVENYLLQCNKISLFDVTRSAVYIIINETRFVSH